MRFPNPASKCDIADLERFAVACSQGQSEYPARANQSLAFSAVTCKQAAVSSTSLTRSI